MAAVAFYAKKLRIHTYDAEIQVAFKHGFVDLFGCYATCDYPETGKIVIDVEAKLAKDRILPIMAHELVHAKQWLKGELSTTKNGKYQLWKGKKIPASIPYSAEPWEVEAMRKENIMAHQYLESLE